MHHPPRSATAITLVAIFLSTGCATHQPEQSSAPSAPPTPAPVASAAPARTPAPVAAAPAPATTRASKPAAPDDSLSTEEYIQKGMPAHDRDWSGADMVKASRVITALAAEPGAGQLPHFASTRSGRVFARLVATENLTLARDRSLPLSTRLPDLLTYVDASNAILKAYLAEETAENFPHPRDLIELMGYQLQMIAALLDAVDEFMPTIPKDDPKYAVRMQGLDKMRSGAATCVAGSLLTLTESRVCPAPDRAALIEHLKQTLPSILPHLTEASRTEAISRIGDLAHDQSLSDLHPAIDGLFDVVKQPPAPNSR